MNKTYVIQWKSRVNGRTGRGTKLFDQAEAERLAQELNREYPQIEHEVVETLRTEEAPLGLAPAPSSPQPQETPGAMHALAA